MAINAPIVIFTYRRKINVLINSLLKNKEAINSELFIFSDGFKSNYDKNDVLIVRKTLKEIKGFKSVKIIESNINKGLARSIIEGVDLVIKKLKRVIVLEDDLKVSPYFISYMNSCLEHYCDNKKIWSISGYGPPLKNIKDYKEDVYLSLRSSSWGWSTWIDRWNKVDWRVKNFNKLKKDKKKINQFEKGGNDLFKMLELQHYGKIDSWAIRWCYAQFEHSAFSITPKVSLIKNLGFNDKLGTHNLTRNKHWHTKLSNLEIKNIKCSLNQKILYNFKKYHDIKWYTKVGYFLRKWGGYQIIKSIQSRLLNF